MGLWFTFVLFIYTLNAESWRRVLLPAHTAGLNGQLLPAHLSLCSLGSSVTPTVKKMSSPSTWSQVCESFKWMFTIALCPQHSIWAHRLHIDLLGLLLSVWLWAHGLMTMNLSVDICTIGAMKVLFLFALCLDLVYVHVAQYLAG